jgi:ABC-2 type transport system ATP-binding protein
LARAARILVRSARMSEPVVRLHDLSKNYGEVRALDSLALDLPPGAVGLLGPNGAGKTTLIKLLLGLLDADSGSASILGFDPARPSDCLELRRRVGYMPEGDCLPPSMSAVEIVGALGRLAGLSFADSITRAHEALDYAGLDEARYRDIAGYSTGMKQRVKLAQALVHDPPLLLLDEPTNGLDPKARRHMLELVHELGHGLGKSLLLCSHLLPDVERTCDHVVVLQRGRAVESGAIADLTRSDGLSVRVRVADRGEDFAAALAAAGRRFEREEPELFRVVNDGEDCDLLFEIAAGAGVPLASVEPVRSTLDEVFVRALREAGA